MMNPKRTYHNPYESNPTTTLIRQSSTLEDKTSTHSSLDQQDFITYHTNEHESTIEKQSTQHFSNIGAQNYLPTGCKNNAAANGSNRIPMRSRNYAIGGQIDRCQTDLEKLKDRQKTLESSIFNLTTQGTTSYQSLKRPGKNIKINRLQK
jgi:hypothetical protein